MKKIILLVILMVAPQIFAQSLSSFFKKKHKVDFTLTNKQQEDLKKYFSSTDSIGAVELRDNLIKIMNDDLTFLKAETFKRPSDNKENRVVYIYKNKNKKEVKIGYFISYKDNTTNYDFEILNAPLNSIYPIWEQKIYPKLTQQEFLKQRKYQQFLNKEKQLLFTFKKDLYTDNWTFKN